VSSPPPPRPSDRLGGDGTHHQAARFLVVGATTVAIDFVLYQLLHRAGLPLDAAKAVSFVLATVCAYLLNRSVTFRAAGGRRVAGRFVALYTVALVVNVGVNAAVLALLHPEEPVPTVPVVVAFLAAQVVSSTLNFLGMRSWVFTDR
jgi:putative flippase GtrA